MSAYKSCLAELDAQAMYARSATRSFRLALSHEPHQLRTLI